MNRIEIVGNIFLLSTAIFNNECYGKLLWTGAIDVCLLPNGF